MFSLDAKEYFSIKWETKEAKLLQKNWNNYANWLDVSVIIRCAINLAVDKKEIEAMYKKVDKNTSGLIDMASFSEFMKQLGAPDGNL